MAGSGTGITENEVTSASHAITVVCIPPRGIERVAAVPLAGGLAEGSLRTGAQHEGRVPVRQGRAGAEQPQILRDQQDAGGLVEGGRWDQAAGRIGRHGADGSLEGNAINQSWNSEDARVVQQGDLVVGKLGGGERRAEQRAGIVDARSGPRRGVLELAEDQGQGIQWRRRLNSNGSQAGKDHGEAGFHEAAGQHWMGRLAGRWRKRLGGTDTKLKQSPGGAVRRCSAGLTLRAQASSSGPHLHAYGPRFRSLPRSPPPIRCP